MYQLEIKTVGKLPEPIYVYVNRQRQPAMFHDKRDAEMAARIVMKYNSNSAFEYVRVV